LAARHQLLVGVRGGVDIVQHMVRAALDASRDWADMQGDAFCAFNEFPRRPMYKELSSNPVHLPLLHVAAMLYGRPSTLHVYYSSHAYLQYPWRPSRLRSWGLAIRNSCLSGIRKVGCDCPERIHCLCLF
jgi:hypothetical protein